MNRTATVLRRRPWRLMFVFKNSKLQSSNPPWVSTRRSSSVNLVGFRKKLGKRVHRSRYPILYLARRPKHSRTSLQMLRHICYIIDSQTNLIQGIVNNKETIVTYLVRALKEWLNDLEPSLSTTWSKTSSLNCGKVWSITGPKQMEKEAFITHPPLQAHEENKKCHPYHRH